MTDERGPDGTDNGGFNHRAMMCVGCIVSGLINDETLTVTTACDLQIPNTDDYRDTRMGKCPDCLLAKDPENCGYCGDPVNVRWS